MTESVVALNVKQLTESPANVRRTFAAPALADLAGSIAAQGIIEPLIVRPLAADHYEIVAGARRFRAAQLVKLDSVPCVVRQLSDAQVREMQLVENLQREGISALEEAGGYAELRKTYSVDQLAAKVGKSRRYVWQRLQLLKLQTSAQRALAAGTLSAGVAELLARTPAQVQGAFVKKWAQQEDAPATVDQAQEWLDQHTHALERAPWPLEDAKLVKAAGACANCPKNTANEPDADKRGKARCLDPSCWAGKIRATLDVKLAQLARAKVKPVLLTSSGAADQYGRGRSFPYLEDQRRHTAKCPPATVGLVVDGNQVAQLVQLCTSKACKVHGQGGRSAADKAATTRQRKAMEATRKRNQQRLLWAGAVASRAARTPLGPEPWRVIARTLLEEEHHESRVAVCRLRGLEPKPGKRSGFNYQAAVAKAIDQAKGPALLELVWQLVLAPDVERQSYWGTRKRLEPLAQRLRVKAPKLPAPRKPSRKERAQVKRASKARRS